MDGTRLPYRWTGFSGLVRARGYRPSPGRPGRTGRFGNRLAFALTLETGLARLPADWDSGPGHSIWWDVEWEAPLELSLHYDTDDFRAAMFRDVMGSRYRPVVACPTGWTQLDRARRQHVPLLLHRHLTRQVLSLAEAAFDNILPCGRLDPARMNILADALEDEGCSNQDFLLRLRGREPCPGCNGSGVLYRSRKPFMSCVDCGLRDEIGRRHETGPIVPGSGSVLIHSGQFRNSWPLDLVRGKYVV
jgi:hypothetical protein